MTDIDRLLTATSRTFGISIPLLDEPHRRHLTLAYLLFRVADTLEDAERVSRDGRTAALRLLSAALRGGERVELAAAARDWVGWGLSSHPGYQELLGELPSLMAAIDVLDADIRRIIVGHAARTVDGMLQFVEKSGDDGNLQLETLDDLRRYCYFVAGIVGEMITELLVEGEQGAEVEQLHSDAALFGEGLQLVNILRDAADDARHGRSYLPAAVRRADIFELARNDLQCAERYVNALRARGLGLGIVPFAEFPLRLAQKTLDRVERDGTGVKLARREVAELLLSVDDRLHTHDQLPSSLRVG